jgi:hypothetical protein
MNTIDIYRSGSLLVTIKPDGSSNQSKKIMGENVLNISFDDSRFIQFAINDYCTVFGEKYILTKLPGYTKLSRFLHRYSLILVAEGMELAKTQCLFLGAGNTLTEADFSLMGTADQFIDLVLQNANRTGSGWTKGQVIDGGYKNLTFSKDNCYNALGKIAEAFETEFWIVGKTIHLTKRSNDTGYAFKHGRNNGLYEINRTNLNDSDIVTRLYVFGADKNLPPNYNGTRLRLPGYYPYTITNLTCYQYDLVGSDRWFYLSYSPVTSTGVTDINIEYRLHGTTTVLGTIVAGNTVGATFFLPEGDYDFRFITIGGVGHGQATSWVNINSVFTDPLFAGGYQPYLEQNVSKYGVIEYTEIFDDIFPSRTGKVTSVNASDPFRFYDTSIDFDINGQLLPGVTPKVVFNTGQLAGYQFDISRFDNGTKEITILQNKDERSIIVPSVDLRPAIGDEYILIDLVLPQTYIEAAEIRLRDKAQALLDQLSQPQLSYTMIIDPVFMKRYNRSLQIGDMIWMIDLQLELQRKIRVTATSRNINNEYSYQVELSDVISPGTISLIINAQQTSSQDIQGINQLLTNYSIFNNKVIGDLLVKQGSIIIEMLPTTNTITGFSEILVENATGKLFRKI